MGTLGDGNGGNWPPEGGGSPDDLPDLPPEWGTIVIPDDPAALADEAAQVRRELRRQAWLRRWRRRLHLPPRRHSDEDGTSMGVPLMIVTIAVLATMVSLFAIAWPGHTREAQSQPPTASPPDTGTPAANQPSAPGTLPDLTLVGADGAPLRLRDTLPAVLLLVDGCACDKLVADATAAVASVDPTIAVVTVARTTPAAPPAGPRRWAAADATGSLWSAFPALPTGTGRASALLVDGTGTLVAVVPAVESVDQLRADLPRLRR